MTASSAVALVFLGAFVGAIASFFNVLFVKGALTGAGALTFIVGGAAGGAIAGLCLQAGSIGRNDIVLVALAGYFVADVAATIASGGARRAP